jgi:Fe-S cluster biogenesis protein NfuA
LACSHDRADSLRLADALMDPRHDLDQRTHAIEALVHTLESAGDSSLRATARELVQALMELHRAGLERTLDLVHQTGEPGRILIDRLAEDNIVKHLLVLHGLHPLDLRERVERALEKARPALESRSGHIERVTVDTDGAVAIVVAVAGGAAQGCGSPGAAIKTAIEDAIYESAPDALSLTIDVRAGGPAEAAFVPLASLRRRAGGAVASSDAERRVAHP